MNPSTMVLILALLLAVWWLMRKRRAAITEDSSPKFQSSGMKSAYHAVSIRFSSDACDAAKAMAGRRFLASAPPNLPLAACDVLQCNCHFNHHDDRRAGKERRSPFGSGRTMGGTGKYNQDRRAANDRRASTNHH